MFTFQEYLGFLVIMVVLVIGFWSMFFLVSILPYWIGGTLKERWKEKREEKRKKQELKS
jgi:hypothetical protein